MKERTIILMIGLLAVAGTGTALLSAEPDPLLASLVETERGFARAAGEQGIRDSFLAHLAEDSILFRPGPMPGRDYILAQGEMTGSLEWGPAYAEVSASGDLGFTTGPYEYRDRGPDGEIALNGHYVSVWRKKEEGGWQLILDIGNTQPESDLPEGEPALTLPDPSLSNPGGRRMPGEALYGILLDSESYIARGSSDQGLAAGLMGQAAGDIRLLRNGREPITGLEAVRRYLGGGKEKTEYLVERAEISQAGDLGYSWGNAILDSESDGQPAKAAWLRIWRFRGDTGWRVIVDVLVPVPGEKEPVDS